MIPIEKYCARNGWWRSGRCWNWRHYVGHWCPRSCWGFLGYCTFTPVAYSDPSLTWTSSWVPWQHWVEVSPLPLFNLRLLVNTHSAQFSVLRTNGANSARQGGREKQQTGRPQCLACEAGTGEYGPRTSRRISRQGHDYHCSKIGHNDENLVIRMWFPSTSVLQTDCLPT